MKIAIFENEYDTVRGAFEVANLITFNNSLKFVVYPASQYAEFSTIHENKVIFIDIDLSSKSKLDGFSLIEKIYEIDPVLIDRIVILTGNNKIEEMLIIRNVNYTKIRILNKPTNYIEVSEVITKVIEGTTI